MRVPDPLTGVVALALDEEERDNEVHPETVIEGDALVLTDGDVDTDEDCVSDVETVTELLTDKLPEGD